MILNGNGAQAVWNKALTGKRTVSPVGFLRNTVLMVRKRYWNGCAKVHCAVLGLR